MTLRGRSCPGESVQFGGDASSLGRTADRWKISWACQRLASAAVVWPAARAGLRVSLTQGAGDPAGQVPGLPVMCLGPVEVTAEPVQRPQLVEHLSLTVPVADAAVDAKRRLLGLSRARASAAPGDSRQSGTAPSPGR